MFFYPIFNIYFSFKAIIYYICNIIGGLAHLARVLAWQARGDEFESRILHQKQNERLCNYAEPFLFQVLKESIKAISHLFKKGFFDLKSLTLN